MVAFGKDTSAVASGPLAMLVAGVIFLASVSVLLYQGDRVSDPDTGESGTAAALTMRADDLLSLLLESPGYAQPTGTDTDWTTSPEALKRLGLLEPSGERLSFVKFENLRRAPFSEDTNGNKVQDAGENWADGYVNYPEALESLGLTDAGMDFHIRAYPSLKAVQDILNCVPADACRDPNLRLAYIGDVEAVSQGGGTPTDGLVVGPLSCSVRADGKAYTLSNEVTNGGTTTVQFSGIYEAELGAEAEFEDRTRSYLVGTTSPDNTVTLSVDVPATAGRSCSGDVSLELWDSAVRLGNEHEYTLTAGTTAPSTVAKDLWVNPDRTYYAGDPVVLEFGGDLPKQGNDPSVTLTLSVKTAAGATVYGPTTFTVTKSIRSVTVPASAFDSAAATGYVAELTYDETAFTQYEPLLVLPAGQAPDTYTPTSGVDYVAAAPVAVEVAYLESLVDRFCPTYFGSTVGSPIAGQDWSTPPNGIGADDTWGGDGTTPGRCASFKGGQTQPGDVFPDTHDVMNNDLAERLVGPDDPLNPYQQQCHGNIHGAPRYTLTSVLVVGSNVDHNAMTSGVAKYSVCEWVMGGGTLIVFGSVDQQVNWLEPIFSAAIRSSSGGISVPDASHPVLHSADDLSYDTYNNQGRVWRFNGQAAQAQQDPATQFFTNVVTDGGDAVLTVSDPGAFGEGTVILTTWLPYDLNGPQPGSLELEGLKLINNLLMQGYRDLFLDYGPPLPAEGRDVIPAVRGADICHPGFDDPTTLGVCERPIALDIIVYVF